MCGCFAELAREMGFGLEVSGWEVEQAEQGRKNYSVLTLEKLARENPGDELYLAIGSDMLLSFDGWHRWEDILQSGPSGGHEPEYRRRPGSPRQGPAAG